MEALGIEPSPPNACTVCTLHHPLPMEGLRPLDVIFLLLDISQATRLLLQPNDSIGIRVQIIVLMSLT